ncbi:MAG: hypothetical protein ACE5ID_03850 [Acidobacteriota bacterium]
MRFVLPVSLHSRWLILPLVCSLGVVAAGGCSAKKQTKPSTVSSRQTLPPASESQGESLNAGIWIQPRAHLEWHRAGLLAALALPRDWQPETLHVMLNGRDVTPGFLPAYAFAQDWIPQAKGEGRVGLDMLGVEESRGFASAWRAVSVLRARNFTWGENRLVADVLDGNGRR